MINKVEIEIQNSVYLMITNFFYPNDQFDGVMTYFFSSSLIKMGTYRVQHTLTTSIIQKKSLPYAAGYFLETESFYSVYDKKNMRSHVAYSKR